MEKENKSKKALILIIIGILVVTVIAITAVVFADKKTEEKPVTSNSSADNSSNMSQSTDDKLYITNCDSTDNFKEMSNIQVVSDEGMYVEGKGAFLNSSTLPIFCSAVFENPIDISKFKGGSLHISFYLSSKANFKNDICFEISSSGTFDKDELQWNIPLSKVSEGWNEKYLMLTDAIKTDAIDLKSVNFFRFYSPDLDISTSLDVILDDVYLSKTAGEDSKGSSSETDKTVQSDSFKESDTNKGKRIMSCNTVNILSSCKNLEVTSKQGEFVEGTGAMKLTNPNYAECSFKNPIDISAYKNDESKVHISFYINDVSYLKDFTYFYLSSAGSIDEQAIYWYLYPYQFESGWNELYLPIYTSTFKRNPDFSSINYFKVNLLNVEPEANVIIDDIYITDK